MRATKATSYLLFCVLLALCANTYPQSAPDELNADALTARIANSTPEATLADEEKTEAQAAVDLARTQLQQIQERAQRVTQYTETANSSAATVAELKDEIAAIESAPVDTTQPDSVEAVRNALALLVAERASNTAALEETRAAQNALSARGPAIVTEIATLRETLTDVSIVPDDAAPGSLAYAQQTLALARLLGRRRAVADLQVELTSIPERQAINEQRVAINELRAEQLAARIGVLTQGLSATRIGRAETAVAQAQEDLQRFADASTRVQPSATENLAFAQELNKMVSDQHEIDVETELLREQIAGIEQSRQVVERVLATGRLTDELGVLLRNVRTRQLRITPLEQRVRLNEEARIAQELNPIIWQERLERLSDPDAANRLVAETNLAGEESAPATPEELAAINFLIEQRRSLLADLIDSARISRERLVDQAILLADIINQTSELTGLLDRRLLWLRNQDPIARDWLTNLPAAFAWLLNPRAWQGALKDLVQQILLNPFIALLGFLPPVLIVANRKRLRKTNANLALDVGHVGNDTYWSTPLALLISCILALPVPFWIAAVAVMLSLGDGLSPFSITLIPALTALASLTFLLFLFRMLSRPNGIFETHYQWSEASLRKLHLNLFWFTWVQCSATFAFTLAVNSVDPGIRYSLGLLGFVALSVGMSIMAYVFMNPINGIFVSISEKTQASVTQKLLFPLFVAIPLVIGVTPLFGYFDTAVLLQSLVFQSGLLLLLVAMFHGLATRMLKVAHRRFSLRQVLQIRANTESERKKNASSEPVAENEDESTEVEKQPDYVDEMSHQLQNTITSATLLLFGLGMWLIWRPLFPTIGIAEDIVLWQGTRVVDGVSISQGVTLWNLFIALLFLFGGSYVARHIRGFLEVGLFGRLSLDAGARYAAASIAGYTIVAITALIGLGQLGIDWSKMQWILAALGVGLGFGLQEIVANFVSGLIILFERPVRVGDIVTIGELTGTVSKISIRATTIEDFDHREVLLPNKSIITDNVVNWTLNDPVTRIIVKIGVAYGSDLRKVSEILLEIATAHEDVLDTPAPLVFLIEHGDSSINFELRVFVSSPPMRWPVAHDINIAINTALANNGIQIPFPQRDVHLFDHSVKDPA
jgi:potassium efflux system protein